MHSPATLPCPHCNQPFLLTFEYLSQYGGQVTQCPQCAQAFTLPSAGEIFSATLPAPLVYQPTQAMPVLGYAGPQVALDGGWQILREGNQVVVRDGTEFPHVCIKCGQPGSGALVRRKMNWVPLHPLRVGAVRVWPGALVRRKMNWVPSIYYSFLLFSWLIAAIVILINRKNATVHIGLCEIHRRKWRRDMWIGVAVGCAGIAGIGVAIYVEIAEIGLLATVAILIGAIIFAVAQPLIRARRIDKGYVWIGGIVKTYRDRLRTTDEARAATYGNAADSLYAIQ